MRYRQRGGVKRRQKYIKGQWRGFNRRRRVFKDDRNALKCDAEALRCVMGALNGDRK